MKHTAREKNWREGLNIYCAREKQEAVGLNLQREDSVIRFHGNSASLVCFPLSHQSPFPWAVPHSLLGPAHLLGPCHFPIRIL